MRTLDQNSFYWIVVNQVLDFYTKHEANFYQDAFDDLKDKNGADIIHAMLKLRFNKGNSTRFKDDDEGKGKDKMGNYIDNIRQFFWDKYQYDIPPSNTPRIYETL